MDEPLTKLSTNHPPIEGVAGTESAPQPDQCKSIDHHLDAILHDLLAQTQDGADGDLASAFVNVERAKREWEATVDALPELICVADEDGRLVRANRTVERWSLGTVTNVRGKELHRFLHPDCHQTCWLARFLADAWQRASSGQSTEQEHYDEVLRRHLLIRLLPVRKKDHDSRRHLAIILQDITRRREMESALTRNNERLRVLNAINVAILEAYCQEEIAEAVLKHMYPLVPFQQGYVLLFDPDRLKFQILASAAENSKEGLAFSDLSAPAFGDTDGRSMLEMSLVADLAHQKDLSQFERHILSQGSRSYVSAPLAAGNQSIGVLAVAMDSLDSFTPEQIQIVREVAEMLTVAMRQTQLYRRLQQTNDELQGLLRLRHADIREAPPDGGRNAKRRGRRSPRQEDVFGPLTAQQIQDLDRLKRGSDQLLFMVNGLFRIRRIDETSLDKVRLDPIALMKDELDTWRVPASNKGIHIIVEIEDELPAIVADPARLRQALSSLLDNALSNSSFGDSILFCAKQKESGIVLSVSDEGAAISPHELDRMFSRYHRANSNMPQEAIRLGLGLVRCEAIIEAHGGRIWAECGSEGARNTFFAELPAISWSHS